MRAGYKNEALQMLDLLLEFSQTARTGRAGTIMLATVGAA
jgi:hypothetical protein